MPEKIFLIGYSIVMKYIIVAIVPCCISQGYNVGGKTSHRGMISVI